MVNNEGKGRGETKWQYRWKWHRKMEVKWTKNRCKEEGWGKLSEPRREDYSAGGHNVEQSWIRTAVTAWGNGIEVGAAERVIS